jgi:hypothetical protein
MNIDQRLEALTHAAEMSFQRQNSHDDNLDRLFEVQRQHEANLDRLFEMQARNEAMQAKNELVLADLMESVNSLARIAHAHETRIENLEDVQ